MIRRFTLNRFGEFGTKKSGNQCAFQGHDKYSYIVKITTSTKLDANGFVIEQSLIHDAVVFSASQGSCEQLCEKIEKAVRHLLISHDVKLYEIYVKVEPIFPKGVESKAFMELSVKY